MTSFQSSTDMSGDKIATLSTTSGSDSRKPWSTPLVIVSVARNTEANVSDNTDGTSTGGFQYGS
jgi:hypothetical protein